MPVLTDEDVGLSQSYLSDEDVGLVEDEMEGMETQSPEELERDERKADAFAAQKEARKSGVFSERAANVLGVAGQVVEPFAVTPQNPLGAFGTVAKGMGHVAGYTGQVGKGIAQDVRLGNITGLPATSQAISTGRAPNLEPTSLPARIIEGGAQGLGSMAPAIAATAMGVPPMAAYPALMGSQAYQETGGNIPATARAAMLGAVLPAISSVAKAAAAKAIVGATRYAPALASSPTISKAVEEGASQIAQNAVAGIVEAPELMALYKEDPARFYDKAAEMIGVNLAMGAHDIMRIADPAVRSQSGQEIAELIRPKMPEMFERFTPPERGGIPEPVKTTGEPNVIQEPGRKAQPANETPQVDTEAPAGAIPIRAAEPQGEVQGGGKELPGVQPETQPAINKAKWIKATDLENLRAATPEQRTAAAEKPLDVESFTMTDKEGFKAVDVEKLSKAVEGGLITSGDAAVDALLLHLIKPSENHPLTSIRMLDFTPGEAQLLTGTSAPFHGRFSKKANKRTAMIEMTMKMQRGEPVTSAQFMETITHELGHNNITSKFKDAPPEIQADVDNLFKFVQEKGRGTEFEQHNALTSAHELFAELADPKVHKWLSELDYSGDIRKVDVGVAQVPAISPPNIRNSALGRFLEIAKRMLKLPDFIRDAFGNKVETITALDQMVSLSSRLERVRRTGGEPEVELNRAKDFKSEIADVEKVSNEELVKQGGSVTKFMWDLGAKAKTAEDVAALKAMAEESRAKAEELMEAGDFEGAMAVAGRQPAEAYEFATGVKITGEPKWPVLEKMNPGYVPPVPDASYVTAKGGAAKPAETPVVKESLTTEQNPNESGGAPAPPAPQSQKWTGATEDSPGNTLGGQTYAGFPNPAAVYAGIKQAVKDFGPGVKAAGKVVADATKAIYKENLDIRKMNDLDRSVLNWSAKLQRSFGESMSAQKEIQGVAKSKVSDEALSNWLEAHGDTATLTAQRDATTDLKLKAGYEAALNLTPEQVQMAHGGRGTYDQLWKRAERWGLVDKDPTKPSGFRDDYVTHIWNLGNGAFAGGSRTLKDQFKFAKARTFQNYFEGEQAGFKPKTKRLSQLLPIYIHEMNSVIAAKQLVKQMWGGKAKDGSPLLATRGQATPVSGAKGEAVLVKPEAASPDSNKKGLDISKYKELPNQPALHDWTFIGKDTAGNPVYEKSDLVLHPEAYKKLNAILGKSKIREWYESEGSATMAIPKTIAKGLDLYQQETKRTMFGLLAPFHQVQEGWHGIGHRILPSPVTGGDSTKAAALKLPRPDLDNPEIYDMAKNGLMILPDRASEAHFMEGMRHSGLVSYIPGIGKLSDGYSKYLFHEVIPGLKIKTYAAALERNKGVYKDDLASGEVKLEDVKLLTATQVNAAYGHLNYADLGRNPTFQHILQLGLLAPDFLEARARFFGQGLKGLVPELGPKGKRISGARGNKVGREQLYALATLAAAQALLAYTAAQLVDGEWDAKHPFEMRKGNRKYTLRSVPEDAQRFFEDIHNVFSRGGEIPFISHRLNPITGRGPLQLLTGRDWRQQKVTPAETAKQLALAPVPLSARGFMDIDKSPLEDWEELAGAVGLKIMRYSAQNETRKLFNDWKKKSENPRLVAQAEQAEAQTFGESEYADLRQALEKDNLQQASAATTKLLETRTIKEIKRAMNPVSIDPFTGASRDKMLPKALESEFLGSLTDKEREVYEAAKRERRVLWGRFQKMLSE